MVKVLSPAGRQYRLGVGVMLLNRRGEVFVAQRIDQPNEAWQMPQGGIDDGENPRQAALRELKEEIGTDSAEFIGESEGWLRYEFPPEIQKRVWDGRWLGQCQKWFVMRFTGEDKDIDLATEHPEFVAWRWAAVRDLPALAVSFKRQVYRDVIAEFADVALTVEERISELLMEPIVKLTMAADGIAEQELYDLLREASKALKARSGKDLEE
jgi:putative (di)nucleoside polyphosphate hydrolase